MLKTLKFSNGDELPMLGLGTWKSAPGEVGAAIESAVRMGYRHEQGQRKFHIQRFQRMRVQTIQILPSRFTSQPV